MTILLTSSGNYELHQWETEKEFEEHIIKNAVSIFGNHSIYIDCKRRIGTKGLKNSIPDAYLFDFHSRHKPKLFVVEIEIASHDLFQHIGVQILQFAHSFTSSPRKVKQVLYEEIEKDKSVLQICEDYAREYGLRNVDNMLDQLVNDSFNSLVIIDDAEDELHMVLKHINPHPEVLEVVTYENSSGELIHRFSPLFDEVTEKNGTDNGISKESIDITEVDTIVVPAREDGFVETFLGENRWYEIRIHASMIPQIKYIAAYQVAPISAITHWALVKNIEPWQNTGKFVVNFADTAKEIGPIRLVPKSRVKALQNARYTSFIKLSSAKNLDEVF